MNQAPAPFPPRQAPSPPAATSAQSEGSGTAMPICGPRERGREGAGACRSASDSAAASSAASTGGRGGSAWPSTPPENRNSWTRAPTRAWSGDASRTLAATASSTPEARSAKRHCQEGACCQNNIRERAPSAFRAPNGSARTPLWVGGGRGDQWPLASPPAAREGRRVDEPLQPAKTRRR